MEYTISAREKRWQRNLPYQLWRLMVLSVRFMKLTHMGNVKKAESGAQQGGSARLSAAPR